MLAMALLLHGGLGSALPVSTLGPAFLATCRLPAGTRSWRGPGPHHAPPLVEDGLEPPTRAPHTWRYPRRAVIHLHSETYLLAHYRDYGLSPLGACRGRFVNVTCWNKWGYSLSHMAPAQGLILYLHLRAHTGGSLVTARPSTRRKYMAPSSA
eukprot:COSAG05_NODE_8297_length_717_cov_1.203883_1_plen_153_part_00